MTRTVLGLDLGSNSIGWAILEEKNRKPSAFLASGVRIFNRAVEEKTPTPKNIKRRQRRLARRVIQRRARRKQRLLAYLAKLGLLPVTLVGDAQPEKILNSLGDPYHLRAKALDQRLDNYELGRVLLHLVQRRGFLSNRKTVLGDMADDPDVLEVLAELEAEEDTSSDRAKEETAFKKDISVLRNEIDSGGYRTLGEYLASKSKHELKRNRQHAGGHLRTDRQMYREELAAIFDAQTAYHPVLTEEVRTQIDEIIFKQRPLKLRSDRVGKCSLEKGNTRARMARLEVQRFRYLQDINNLRYFDPNSNSYICLTDKDREKLVELFESKSAVTFPQIRKTLGLDRKTDFKLDYGTKKLKGNITSVAIREAWEGWDDLSEEMQHALVEDLITINKKSVLKKRLITHWQMDVADAVNLAMLEFEPEHSNLSVKAINKLMPHLRSGQIYSDARVSAGYGYEKDDTKSTETLGPPPDIPNPIVSKGLSELRRVINALIKEYGKPDVIRIEMARDLEMNTKRYAQYLKQQKANTLANDKATEEYQQIGKANSHLGLSAYPSHTDKIKYRLWEDQNRVCAYSSRTINLTTLFSADVEIDHILPFSESLDDSYMNKVVCFAAENRAKGQRTPIDAFASDDDKWSEITQAVGRWNKRLQSKRARFFMTAADVIERDFISSQLNDTRYISRVANDYLATLGCDISVSKGITTAWLRYQWNLNSLLGTTSLKERADHRHHLIDAAVIACVDRNFYKTLVGLAKNLEATGSGLTMNDLHTDPPWMEFRDQLWEQLDEVIVSHEPQRKIMGALHEETGVGFVEGKGNVYRLRLTPDFKDKQVSKIIDDAVRECVEKHLSNHGGDPKVAFDPNKTVYHKDGKTPIKRVRVLQSRTTLKKLQQAKYGVKDKQGKVFKWHAYGNIHHVEIMRNKKSGEVSGKFITAMEAAHRARGVGRAKQPIVQEDHGPDYEFLMALCINDLVRVPTAGGDRIYRIQKLDAGHNAVALRLHTSSTLTNDAETLPIRESTLKSLMTKKVTKLEVNAIGKII